MVLRQAAAHCNVEVLKELKKQGCDFSVKDQNGNNLIHIAVKYNDSQVVSYLLEEKIDPCDVTEIFESDALTIAGIEADRNKIKILKNAGLQWQIEGVNGRDTWIAVCRAGTKESIDIMLKEGFYPSDQEIVYGYSYCNESTFQGLIENNIPYDKEYWDGDFTLTGFSELVANSPDLALQIFDMDSQVTVTPAILENAIDCGNRELALKAIDRADDLNVCFSESPLEVAVYRGNLELVQYLVEKGADINYMIPAEIEEYHTVMHTAAACPSEEILEFLMENGGDTTVKDYENKTPYDYAKESKMTWNIKILENK